MPRVGITGHMNLTPATTSLIREVLRERLARHPREGLTGLSCLARGADSVFADVVLDLGGRLEVFLPSADYRQAKVEPDHATQFDALLRAAVVVHTMPFAHAGRAAYEAANEALLSSCDSLIAVWDRHPAQDRGGTGAVVETARARGLLVEVVWPEGAARG